MDQGHVFNFHNHISIITPILGNQSPETLNNLLQITQLAKGKASIQPSKPGCSSLPHPHCLSVLAEYLICGENTQQVFIFFLFPLKDFLFQLFG